MKRKSNKVQERFLKRIVIVQRTWTDENVSDDKDEMCKEIINILRTNDD